MAKVLFCLPRFHTNSVPWVRLLREGGHDVIVHVQRSSLAEDHALAVPQLIPAAGWSHTLGRLLPRRSDPDFRAAPPLKAYWQRMKADAPDIVVVRGVTRWFCIVAALMALMQGRRVVVYDQDDPQARSFSGTWIRRSLCRLLGMGRITARAAEAKPTGPSVASTLPFGAPSCSENLAREARHRIAQDAGIGRILMVGKYRARKGHAKLLDALAQLATQRHFTLTICAEEISHADRTRRAALEAKVGALGLTDRVCFIANADRATMAKLYASHAIFVLPSLDEPAAVSPIEAVWHGAVALMDQNSGTRHYLPPNDAFTFDARHHRDIARALDPLLAQPERLRELRGLCLNHLQEFGSDEAVRRVLEREVLGINNIATPVDLHPQSSNCRAT